jgi:hypothetical protein
VGSKRRGRTEASDAGFAAADGLIALTLVSVLLVFVMTSINSGVTSSRRSAERRAAAAEVEDRLLSEWPALRRPGRRAARTAHGEGWSLSARLQEAGGGGPALCTVTSALSLSRPARAYRLQTYRFCRDDPGA